jgi:hypothetical protein
MTRRPRLTALLTLILGLAASAAAAQRVPAGQEAPAGQPQAPPAREEEEAMLWPTVRYDWPTKLSAGLLFQPPLKGALAPLLTTFTIGTGGYKAGVGVGWMGGNLAAGYALQLTATRTLGHPEGAEPHQTYLGVEGEFMVANMSIKAGPAMRIGGRTPSAHRFRLNISAGLGF